MEISFKVLNSVYFNNMLSVDTVLKAIGKTCLEINSVKNIYNKKSTLYNSNYFAFGKILKINKIENYNKIKFCEVLIKDKINKIICGASNIKANDVVVVALEGARLNNIIIKKKEIGDNTSCGMICSLSELGIDKKFNSLFQKENDEDGVYIHKHKINDSLTCFENMEISDTIFDVSNVSNRYDLFGLYFCAIEISKILNIKIKEPKMIEISYENSKDLKIVNNSKNILGYSFVKISKITETETPKWIKNALYKSSIRSINIIVDIANWVMIEMGQPLHTYDAKKIQGNIKFSDRDKIDYFAINNNRVVYKNVTLVEDEKKIIGVAGIFGGENTKVETNTSDVLLESIRIDSNYINEKVKNNIISSQAAFFFSKPKPQQILNKSILRYLYLIKKYIPECEITNTYNLKNNVLEKTLLLDFEYFKKIIGDISIDKQIIFDTLKKKFDIKLKNENIYECLIPYWRSDLLSQSDLVTEFINLYGIDKITPTSFVSDNKTKFKNIFSGIDEYLINNGFYKAVNQNFIDYNSLLPVFFNQDKTIEIQTTHDKLYLRPNILSGLLNNALYNLSKNIYEIKLFEISKVLTRDINNNKLFIQNNHIGIIWGINLKKNSIEEINYIQNFHKIFINMLDVLKINKSHLSLNKTNNLYFNKYNSYEIYYKKNYIGIFGEINHYKLSNKTKIKCIFFGLEIDVEKIIKLCKQTESNNSNKISFMSLVCRDITIENFNLSKKNIYSLLDKIKKTSNLIQTVYVLNSYSDDKMLDGNFNTTIRILFQPKTKILSCEIDELIKIIKSIINKH